MHNSVFTQTNKSYLNKHNNKLDDTPLEEIIIDSKYNNTNEDQYRFSPLVNIKKENNPIELKHTYRPTKSLFFDKNFSINP